MYNLIKQELSHHTVYIALSCTHPIRSFYHTKLVPSCYILPPYQAVPTLSCHSITASCPHHITSSPTCSHAITSSPFHQAISMLSHYPIFSSYPHPITSSHTIVPILSHHPTPSRCPHSITSYHIIKAIPTLSNNQSHQAVILLHCIIPLSCLYPIRICHPITL